MRKFSKILIENIYEFKEKKKEDFITMIKNWKQFSVNTSKYPSIPLNSRKFYEIKEFQLFEDYE